MNKAEPAFSRLQTPAAKCLHLVRLNPIITRSELVELTGLSQPTITRAVGSLLDAGLIQQRMDLTRSHGRGRPTVPLELATNNWMLAGIAVGTKSTHIALFDTKGRPLRDLDIETHVAELTHEDFIEHIIAGVHRLSTGLDYTLVSMGVSTSGRVDEDGRVYAPNLGWDGLDVPSLLRNHFGVPVIVSSAIPAILGSETQAADLSETAPVLVLFADDSIGAALSNSSGVRQIVPLPTVSSDLLNLDGAAAERALTTAGVLKSLKDAGAGQESLAAAVAAGEDTGSGAGATARAILDERARLLGEVAAELIDEYRPATVVVAGSAFYSDSSAPKKFAASARAACSTPTEDVELRMIPTHREIVRAVARAVALDQLLRTPLALGKTLERA
ncbi:ROK family transcriptional regulator [Corynebacterium endometrii]|uniref:ROK family protein n=1 Tax=Corynebacterium endometrii TaxID=2488819 RepID=A0A4P7QDG4_9CORY|nr:ROK family transcriptional regulator [Corynebacterium endometrii]QCB27419.1 ROK family protein [Corynebacterium endometrii]